MSSASYSLAHRARKRAGLGRQISQQFIDKVTDIVAPAPVVGQTTNDDITHKLISESDEIAKKQD